MARGTQFSEVLQSSLGVVRDGRVPVGEQLTRKLEDLIRSGELAPGDQLPSVRQLAEAAGVNVNTARAVYARLEQRGVVSSEHGRGTFVRGEPTFGEASAASG